MPSAGSHQHQVYATHLGKDCTGPTEPWQGGKLGWGCWQADVQSYKGSLAPTNNSLRPGCLAAVVGKKQGLLLGFAAFITAASYKWAGAGRAACSGLGMGNWDIQVLLLALLHALTLPNCENVHNAFMFFMPVWLLKDWPWHLEVNCRDKMLLPIQAVFLL